MWTITTIGDSMDKQFSEGNIRVYIREEVSSGSASAALTVKHVRHVTLKRSSVSLESRESKQQKSQHGILDM